MLKALNNLSRSQFTTFITRSTSNAADIMKVLNVAEKNDAAKNISGLLSRGTAQRREGLSKFNKIYTFTTNVPQFNGQCQMTMTSVSGHLLNFDFDNNVRSWNSCSPAALFDAPIKEDIRDGDKSSQAIKKTLEREARNSQGLIIWTDGDREGENIGFEIIRVCHSVNPNLRVLRAKFSEITGRAMGIAINNLVEPDENISKAVDTRRELDLRFGSIFTRFQSLLLQNAGYAPPTASQGRVISYGPCQFPTMGFVIYRYLQILTFRPQQFWSITINDKRDNISATFNWKRHRLFDEHACLAFYSKVMEVPKARVTNVTGKQKSNWRPEPMYTTSMEKLASNKLRISAKEALGIAEKLYTQGYISYPRTETNIFPKGMNLNALVEQQTPHPQWGNFARRILDEGGAKPRVGKKTDNAHPPIHPTKYTNELRGKEGALYELITRHFLACVSKDALGLETVVTVNMNGEEFSANGLLILELNYLEVYPYFKWNAKEIPRYDLNEEFIPQSVMMTEGKTCPPKLLTESELIALMEKNGIGTDATQADHIDKIQERNYVKKLTMAKVARFCPTKLGLALYDGYNEMQFSHLIKPQLRSRLEEDLVKIAESRMDSRDVARQYIEEHRSIYEVVTREQQKLVSAFLRNKNLEEPEIRLRTIAPQEFR